jgi:hypothetical protein
LVKWSGKGAFCKKKRYIKSAFRLSKAYLGDFDLLGIKVLDDLY